MIWIIDIIYQIIRNEKRKKEYCNDLNKDGNDMHF